MERVLLGRSQLQELARSFVEDKAERRGQLHRSAPVEVDLPRVVSKADDPVFAVAGLRA